MSVVVLLGDCVFYIILTWYFDILISSNRGRGESIFFPLKRLYKLIVKNDHNKKKIMSTGIDLTKNQNYMLQD